MKTSERCKRWPKQWDEDNRCKPHLTFLTRRHSLLPNHHFLSECWLVSCRISLFVSYAPDNSIAFVTGIHLSFDCCLVGIALSALPHCILNSLFLNPLNHASLAFVLSEPCSFNERQGQQGIGGSIWCYFRKHQVDKWGFMLILSQSDFNVTLCNVGTDRKYRCTMNIKLPSASCRATTSC